MLTWSGSSDESLRRENESLRLRVTQLEQTLNCLNPGSPSSITATVASSYPDGRAANGVIEQAGSIDAPFPTGSMILAPSGELGLNTEATFYRPVDMRDNSNHTELDSTSDLLDILGVGLPGYLAPHLPFPISADHHQHLINLCFDHQLSFGLNAFKFNFIEAMNRDATKSGLYYSPALHLACLGVG